MNNSNILFHELNQTVRFISKSLNDRLKEHSLYHSQWSILYCLNRYGEMTQTEIWQYLNVEAPTVTRTLSRLEKTGWIHRKTGTDKRERIVSLTEKATQEIPAIEQNIYKFEADILNNLTTIEQEQFLKLLKKIGTPVLQEKG